MTPTRVYLVSEQLSETVSDPMPLEASERFALIGEEIVADRTTGLSWSRGNVGSERLNWKAAADACKALELGGFKDWRLPTIRELLTLVDYERKEPAIDPIFHCESDWYWTSTPVASAPGDFAWAVFFGDGDSDGIFQHHDYHVRAVRSSQ